MKINKAIAIPLLILLVIVGAIYAGKRYIHPIYRAKNAGADVDKLIKGGKIKDGDLIFQTSLSAQSKAIQLATKSQYSHCGILYRENGQFYVFEAIQPVKATPLEKWIARGKDGHFVMKRLKNADRVLTPAILLKMKQEGEKFQGKNYDLTFEWSDDKIYCSELIWKIYHRATGLQIGALQKLREFDLTNKAVRAKMKERYGDKIPMDETVISPAAIFNSDLLVTVATD